MTHNVSEFWLAKINLVNKTDNTDTTHFYIGNRDVQLFFDTGDQPVYPLLESAKLSQKQRGYMPADSQGRVTISNARNSMGVNRRLSDFFDVYTPMYQDIEFYWCEVLEGDSNIAGDVSLVWTDTVTGYRCDTSSENITLQLKSDPIGERTASYEITNELWTGAPDSAYGKHLPICFGNSVEVEAVDVGSDEVYDRYFVYATTWADDFVNGGVDSYWMPDIDGIYQEVDSYNATTDVYGLAQGMGGTVTGYTLLDIEMFQQTYGTVGQSTYGVMYGGQVQLQGASVTGSWSGDIIVRIYQDDGTGNWTQRALGEARIDKSSISTSLGSGVGFYQGFEFDRPVVVKNSSGRIWFSLSNSSSSAATGGTVNYGYGSLASLPWTTQINKKNSTNDGLERVTGHTYAYISLFCLNFTDVPTPGSSVIDDKTGKGASYVVVSQSASSSGNGLDKIKMKLKIQGLEDNSSGSITGVSNQILDGGVEAAELLCGYGWNGSSWVGSTIFDGTFKSSTHSNHNLAGGDTYPRELGGSSRGRVSIKQFLSEIARNSAMFITRLPGAFSVGAYLWGDTQSEAATIYDTDMELQEFFATAQSTIVNNIDINYDRRLINVQFEELVLIDNNIREHASRFSLNYVDNATLLGESKDLYGIRDLANNLFNLFNDATSAESMANFIGRTMDGPAEFCRVVVEYNKFSSLEPFDVVNLQSTNLPYEYGTNPNITPMVMEDNMYSFYFDADLDVYIDLGGSVGRFDGTPGDYACHFELKFNDDLATGETYYYLLNSSDLSTDGIAIRILGGTGDWGTISIVHCSTGGGLEEVQSAANVFLDDRESHTLWVSYDSTAEEVTVWFDGTKVIDAQSLQLWDAPAANTTIGKSSQSFYGWILEAGLWSQDHTDTKYFNILNKNNLALSIRGQESSPLVDLSGNGHTLTQNNGTTSFYSSVGYDPILREAFSQGGDQVGVLAKIYRAQIYDMALDIAKNKSALLDMNLRLLIHANDPT